MVVKTPWTLDVHEEQIPICILSRKAAIDEVESAHYLKLGDVNSNKRTNLHLQNDLILLNIKSLEQSVRRHPETPQTP